MYKVLFSEHFKKQLKPYTKKHPLFKKEFIKCLKNTTKERLIPLGKGLFKLRLKFSFIPKGKNKSFRLIALIIELQNLLTPIAFYFKGDRHTITKEELILHKKIIEHELKL